MTVLTRGFSHTHTNILYPFFYFTVFFLSSPMVLMQIWAPSNPRGAELLPPGIVVAESDFYLRRLWGRPNEVCIIHDQCYVHCS